MKRTCSYCGKEFSFIGYRPKKKFCSRDCYVSAMRSHRPTEELLRKLYWEDQQSLTLVGQKLGKSQSAILEAMRYYGIPTRTNSEGILLAHQQGRVRIPDRQREKHPMWKGGKFSMKGGYIEVLDRQHPRANKHGYVREHILVWERFHNQPLPAGWIVHHLNGITSDNRKENLEALPKKTHDLLLRAKSDRISHLESEVERLESRINQQQLLSPPAFKSDFGGKG